MTAVASGLRESLRRRLHDVLLGVVSQISNSKPVANVASSMTVGEPKSFIAMAATYICQQIEVESGGPAGPKSQSWRQGKNCDMLCVLQSIEGHNKGNQCSHTEAVMARKMVAQWAQADSSPALEKTCSTHAAAFIGVMTWRHVCMSCFCALARACQKPDGGPTTGLYVFSPAVLCCEGKVEYAEKINQKLDKRCKKCDEHRLCKCPRAIWHSIFDHWPARSADYITREFAAADHETRVKMFELISFVPAMHANRITDKTWVATEESGLRGKALAHSEKSIKDLVGAANEDGHRHIAACQWHDHQCLKDREHP